VRDAATQARIKKLAIPPAWTNVWIAPDPAGHVQATGRDARGRKQYRYHADWTSHRNNAKFDRLVDFAHILPAIRRRVAADLQAPPLTRNRVLATVIALLERTHIRVGNEEYARTNGSYGLTTLQNRHVRVRGQHVRFRFKGKSGVRHEITIEDVRLARDVRRCQDLPGQTLFGYRDDRHRVRRVGSADVNAYLASIAGPNVTAKDFRTWWGTVSAAVRLRREPAASSARARKRTELAVLDAVAAELGNTRAICRKCYVHPNVLELASRGTVCPRAGASLPGLNRDETAVVRLLESSRRRDARLRRVA
jgi:DNA topoisomerase-1